MNWESILKRGQRGKAIREEALVEIKSILKEANEPLSSRQILQRLYDRHKKFGRTFAYPESITRLIKRAGANSKVAGKTTVYWV